MANSKQMKKKGRALALKERRLKAQARAMDKTARQFKEEVIDNADAVLAKHEEKGWVNGMHTAMNIANSSRTIGACRKELAHRLSLGR